MQADEETVGHLVSRVGDALGQQADLHIELLKAEFARDATALGTGVAPLALGIPLVGIGYVFACVAATLALAPWLGTSGGAAAVGTLNLIAGSIAIRTSALRLRPERVAETPAGSERGRSPIRVASHGR